MTEQKNTYLESFQDAQSKLIESFQLPIDLQNHAIQIRKGMAWKIKEDTRTVIYAEDEAQLNDPQLSFTSAIAKKEPPFFFTNKNNTAIPIIQGDSRFLLVF